MDKEMSPFSPGIIDIFDAETLKNYTKDISQSTISSKNSNFPGARTRVNT